MVFLRQASGEYRHYVYALKGDIKRFYDSVRHDLLLEFLTHVVHDEKIIQLLTCIIRSYTTDKAGTKGLPLGNATSQLFTNVYLNAFDHFVKEQLCMTRYIRFCDDFVIVHKDRALLEALIPRIDGFLMTTCALALHPQKFL